MILQCRTEISLSKTESTTAVCTNANINDAGLTYDNEYGWIFFRRLVGRAESRFRRLRRLWPGGAVQWPADGGAAGGGEVDRWVRGRASDAEHVSRWPATGHTDQLSPLRGSLRHPTLSPLLLLLASLTTFLACTLHPARWATALSGTGPHGD